MRLAVQTPSSGVATACQALAPPSQIVLQARVQLSQASTPMGGFKTTIGGLQRAERIAQTVLAQLRQLDPGDDRGAPRARCQTLPGIGRFGVPT